MDAVSVFAATGVEGVAGGLVPELRRWCSCASLPCGGVWADNVATWEEAVEDADAEETGALEAEEDWPFEGGSLSRSFKLGTRARPLRRSLTPRSSRALVDMPTLFLGGRPLPRAGGGGTTFCRLGEGGGSASSVRSLFNGCLSGGREAEAEREAEAALESLWFRAARFFCER